MWATETMDVDSVADDELLAIGSLGMHLAPSSVAPSTIKGSVFFSEKRVGNILVVEPFASGPVPIGYGAGPLPIGYGAGPLPIGYWGGATAYRFWGGAAAHRLLGRGRCP